MRTRSSARWAHEREFQTWNKDLMTDLEDMDIGYPRYDRRALYTATWSLSYVLRANARGAWDENPGMVL